MPRGGKRPGAGRKLSYESYVGSYKTKQRKLEANGVKMRQRMYTKEEFKVAYTALKNEKTAMGQKPLNITRELIDKQAFTLSNKQAMAYKGTEQNWYKIRSGGLIKTRYWEAKEEYLEKHPDALDAALYARNLVSMELFGS